MQIIEKPNIIEVIGREGIQLRQRGKYLWALCPFHSEKTPSFMVNPEKQSFKCYGCGKCGDAIDFIQHYKGLPFKDTLVYLGISSNGKVKTNPQESKRRGVVNKFREWCSNYAKYSSEMLRLCNRIDSLIKSPDDMELSGLGKMYMMKDIYQHHLSVLESKNDELKFQMYKEVSNGR